MRYFLLLLCLSAGASAQQRAKFQLFSQIVSLPESGQTNVAMLEGELLEVTPKWAIRNENLVASNGQGYFFGLQYQMDLRKLLEHTNWSHEDFEFYLTGSLGKVYSERNFSDQSAVGGMFGGGLNYLPKHTERFQLDVFELRLARLPHLHGGLAAVVSSGISVGF